MKRTIAVAIIVSLASVLVHVASGSLVDRVAEELDQREAHVLSLRDKATTGQENMLHPKKTCGGKAQQNSRPVNCKESPIQKHQTDAAEKENALIGARIWELDREAIDKLSPTEKIKHTRNLTAEQWNTVFSKFADVDEKKFDSEFGSYVALLDENMRIGFMKCALKSSLWFLLGILVRHEYSPIASSELKELLEESIEQSKHCPKHIGVRVEALRTLYCLTPLPERWYFTSSEEDLGLVDFLVNQGQLTKGYVADRLIDIVESNSDWRVLIEGLQSRNLLIKDAVVSRAQCLKACNGGRIEYLKRVSVFGTLALDQMCMENAVENDDVPIIEFMIQLNPPIFPTQPTVDRAVMEGHYKAVEFLSKLNRPILPTIHIANCAAMSGDYEAVRFLSKLTPSILPTSKGANWAASNGHDNIVAFLSQLNPRIVPNEQGVNWAASNGRDTVVAFLSKLDSPVLPTDGVNLAAMNGHDKVVAVLSRLDPPVLPNQQAVNRAAKKGHVRVVTVLSQLREPLLPDNQGVDWAASSGHYEVVEFLSKWCKPILPSLEAVKQAIREGHYGVVKRLLQLPESILSAQYDADMKAESGDFDFANWLSQLPAPTPPTQYFADWAAKKGYGKVLKGLSQLPEPILPSQEAIGQAASKEHCKFLEYLTRLPALTFETQYSAKMGAEEGEGTSDKHSSRQVEVG